MLIYNDLQRYTLVYATSLQIWTNAMTPNSVKEMPNAKTHQEATNASVRLDTITIRMKAVKVRSHHPILPGSMVYRVAWCAAAFSIPRNHIMLEFEVAATPGNWRIYMKCNRSRCFSATFAREFQMRTSARSWA